MALPQHVISTACLLLSSLMPMSYRCDLQLLDALSGQYSFQQGMPSSGLQQKEAYMLSCC